MKGGTLLYKCRRCGDVRAHSHAPNLVLALACASADAITPEGDHIDMVSVHPCGDGKYGVCDLIGGDEDK